MATGRLGPATSWMSSLTSRDPQRAGPLFAALSKATAEYNRRKQLDQARQAFAGGQTDEARREIDALLRDNPRWAAAMVERARVSLRSDSLLAARSLLEAALPLADDDARYDAYINLGVLSMREGKSAEGIADFARCSEGTVPKVIKPGQSYETCQAFLIAKGGAIVGAVWSEYDPKHPDKTNINWKR